MEAFFPQLGYRHILAHFNAGLKLHAKTLDDFNLRVHHIFFQTVGRNA